MAKDLTQGPVSQYDSEGLPINATRSEVINNFGEELGNRLIEAGFSSLSSISVAVDSVFEELGFGEGKIAALREKAPFTGAPTQEEVEEVTAEVEEDEVKGLGEDEADEADTLIPTIEMDVSILDPERTKANLLDMKLADLREICERDDIQAARSIAETVDRIMEAWFLAAVALDPDVSDGSNEAPMSARVRRIKQASQQQ
jgi:hypothetical protein